MIPLIGVRVLMNFRIKLIRVCRRKFPKEFRFLQWPIRFRQVDP